MQVEEGAWEAGCNLTNSLLPTNPSPFPPGTVARFLVSGTGTGTSDV